MIQSCRETNLTKKTVRSERGRKVGVQDLDRYIASMAKVLSKVDGRHSSSADLPVDLIFPLQRVRQLVQHLLLKLSVIRAGKATVFAPSEPAILPFTGCGSS